MNENITEKRSELNEGGGKKLEPLAFSDSCHAGYRGTSLCGEFWSNRMYW